MHGIEAEAAARGYSPRLVGVLVRLLSIDPAERRTAAELVDFLAESSWSVRKLLGFA